MRQEIASTIKQASEVRFLFHRRFGLDTSYLLENCGKALLRPSEPYITLYPQVH